MNVRGPAFCVKTGTWRLTNRMAQSDLGACAADAHDWGV